MMRPRQSNLSLVIGLAFISRRSFGFRTSNRSVQYLRDYDCPRMSFQTLNDILLTVCAHPRERVTLQRKVLGWVPISSSQLYRNVVGMARARESGGIGKGDRVAILSENRP